MYIDASTIGSTETLLQEVASLQASGNGHRALGLLDIALKNGSDTYAVLYRRAEVLLDLGRIEDALDDLDNAVEIKPEAEQARIRRMTIHMKQGSFEKARFDLDALKKKRGLDAGLLEKQTAMKSAERQIQEAWASMKRFDWKRAQTSIDAAAKTSPTMPLLRRMRAECFLNQGDYTSGLVELRAYLKAEPRATAGLHMLARINLARGEVLDAYNALKQCLHLDPDSPECLHLFKKVRNMSKLLSEMGSSLTVPGCQQVISTLRSLIDPTNDLVPSEYPAIRVQLLGRLCDCALFAKESTLAYKSCTEALKLDERNIDRLCQRAEANVLNEDYESALRDYHQAHQLDRQNRRAWEGYQHAQRLVGQSKQMDYYKILGIPRSATRKDIKKAFRRLVLEWHPDKYHGDDLNKAERRMADINRAYEVLSNEDKRARYDAGDDPLATNVPGGGYSGWAPFYHGFSRSSGTGAGRGYPGFEKGQTTQEGRRNFRFQYREAADGASDIPMNDFWQSFIKRQQQQQQERLKQSQAEWQQRQQEQMRFFQSNMRNSGVFSFKGEDVKMNARMMDRNRSPDPASGQKAQQPQSGSSPMFSQKRASSTGPTRTQKQRNIFRFQYPFGGA